MIVKPIRTAIFREGENLETFILRHVKKIREESVLVVTSKIVALSEGRTADPADRERIIKEESKLAIRTPYTWLTVKDDMVMSSAGIDESNVEGKLVLLPKDSYKTAATLRTKLMKHFGVKKLGVLIPDSRLLPFRAGAVGVAMGYAGFKGIRDYRGSKDIFGRVLKISRTDVADSLATAAVLEMGEGNERYSLALITDARVDFVHRIKKDELKIEIENDLYRPLFQYMDKKK